ncbi:unnamed protein product [Heligmosomoides polygyrus]|uniref:Reverse transcriptase domain-containing protein n=1 Tax=Heligmosomoides polygyrus TaxID=6339 RepID=A0A183FPU0_HELPZ|nr:unnamed protein product [Heligmosomoides polygyrus]
MRKDEFSPLFSVALNFAMGKSMRGDEIGIMWSRRFRSTDLDFADDVATMSDNNDSPQQVTTNLVNEAKKIGLRLNRDKSEVMRIGKTDMYVDASIEASHLETIQKFTYLGSTVPSDKNVESEILAKIVEAVPVFQKLEAVTLSAKCQAATKPLNCRYCCYLRE